MAIDRGYVPFDQNHRDIVTAVDFNFYGTRMVTASADHRIKVYDRKDDNWNIVDTFGAHDAEITDVKWNGPFMGEIFGSVGEDGVFKIWQEDVTEIPNSGRRFTRIFRTSSAVPFMSLDFKNILTESYVALVTRDGYLRVLEPVEHEDLTNWQTLHETYLGPTPDRQDETSFKVAFHHEKLPCWTAVRAGLDRKALSLAVASMDTVKIFRTDKDRRFYQVADLHDARDLVRGVAWANGAMRGWDLIATGSKDGCIRIYELRSDESTSNDKFGSTTVESSPTNQAQAVATQSRRSQKTQSGIGAGLAGSSNDRDRGRHIEAAPGRIKETAIMIEEINLHRGAVWKVQFSQGGDVLGSIGDDGVLRTWKRALDNRWHEYASIDVAED